MARRIIPGAPGGGDIAVNRVELPGSPGTGAGVYIRGVNAVPGNARVSLMEEMTFQEVSAAGTYRKTLALPTGALVEDVIGHFDAQWGSGSSAALSVGDSDSATGYLNAINLKTQTADTSGMGGVSTKQNDAGSGAYGGKTKRYTKQDAIVAVVTTVGGTSTAGLTRVFVRYSIPWSTAAAVASTHP